MHGNGQWLVANSEAGFHYAQAEINVLKPDRSEAFIEAPNSAPSLFANEQKCAGGLLDVLAATQIQIEATPTPVDRISGPDSIDGKIFQGQRGYAGKAAQRESTLRLTALIAQGTRRNGGQGVVETAHQRRDVGAKNCVRVQDKYQLGGRQPSKALVHSSCKARIAWIGKDGHTGNARCHMDGLVLRCIVHNNDPLAGVSVVQAGVQAGAQAGGGLVRNDHNSQAHVQFLATGKAEIPAPICIARGTALPIENAALAGGQEGSEPDGVQWRGASADAVPDPSRVELAGEPGAENASSECKQTPQELSCQYGAAKYAKPAIGIVTCHQ